MQYFVDCEFDGFHGALISMAVMREDGESVYMIFQSSATDPWVRDNVLPVLHDCPKKPQFCTKAKAAQLIESIIGGDSDPVFVTDWTADVRYLCDLMEYAPGQMIDTVPILQFVIVRTDAYPSEIEDAVQHNAWWDARALAYKCGNTRTSELVQ